MMKVIVVPSGFKECLSSEEVGEAIKSGVERIDEAGEVTVIPMVDGGEGFAETIVKLKEGKLINAKVTGPVGKCVDAHFGLFMENGIRTAVIEMAVVAGLKNVPLNQRDPLKTSTYGVGEMILNALDHGAERILIGCGDSGTSDGGVGMAQAVGVRFFDKNQKSVFIEGGGDIHYIESVDTTQIDPRISGTNIDVAVNWKNKLCGKYGVARVFGPQKGASEEDVEILSSNFDHLSKLIETVNGKDLSEVSGGGASGGLGAGLAGFLGAELHPRFAIISKYIEISDAIAKADLVITAEGCIDYQTPNDKIPSEVARIAKSHGKHVIAFAGTIGKKADINYDNGIDAYTSIIPRPATLDTSMRTASKWLTKAAENAIRHVVIGINLGEAKKKVSSLQGTLNEN